MATARFVLEYAVAEDGEVKRSHRLNGEALPDLFPTTTSGANAAKNTFQRFEPVTDKVLLGWARQAVEGIARRRFDVTSARMMADVTRIKPLSGFRIMSAGYAIRLEAGLNSEIAGSGLFDVMSDVVWQFAIDGDTLLSVVGGSGPNGIGLHWSRFPHRNPGVAPIKVDIAKVLCLGYVDQIEALVEGLTTQRVTGPLERLDASRF